METIIIYVLVAFTFGLVTGLSLARPRISAHSMYRHRQMHTQDMPHM